MKVARELTTTTTTTIVRDPQIFPKAISYLKLICCPLLSQNRINFPKTILLAFIGFADFFRVWKSMMKYLKMNNPGFVNLGITQIWTFRDICRKLIMLLEPVLKRSTKRRHIKRSVPSPIYTTSISRSYRT